MKLRKTPLNSAHRKLGAKMVPFAGWEMPVQYESALKEHLAVRESVGVFDVSHMGQITLQGPDALSMAHKVTSNDVHQLADGQAQYSAFLSPEGTFIDDIVLYRISAEYLFICVNASNRKKDFQWLQQQKEGEVEVADQSDHYAQLAIQGPTAEGLLQKLTDIDLANIHYYQFTSGSLSGVETLISRTGYTGEDGFEIYIPAQEAESIWHTLFSLPGPPLVRPAGLAARNTLRLEMSYALYGNDIDHNATPLEAGLEWIVKLYKSAFIGKESLQKQRTAGVRRKLVGFEMLDRGIARDSFKTYIDRTQVGQVTSGSFSPSLKKSIGLTYLPVSHAQPGQLFDIEIRGELRRARVAKTPFYRRRGPSSNTDVKSQPTDP